MESPYKGLSSAVSPIGKEYVELVPVARFTFISPVRGRMTRPMHTQDRANTHAAYAVSISIGTSGNHSFLV